MPKSSRYTITELPGTLQRSCREARDTFLKAATHQRNSADALGASNPSPRPCQDATANPARPVRARHLGARLERPFNRMFVHILAVIGEFEADLIRQHT
jgi:hypothetical protein